MTFFEELLRAVVWFHPAVWLILPRISLTREQVVDADTVRLTGKRRQYLEALWRVICSSRHSVAAVAVPFLGRRDLVDRVSWLQKEMKMSKTRVALTILVLAVTVPAVAVFGANVFRADAQPALSMSGMLDTGSEKEKAEGSEEKLKTVSADSICDEITHPVVVEKINPKYPPSAREEKVMGNVIVETVITEDGIVDEIMVVDSPDERLSSAAVEAIKQWRFDPALCDGEPVGVYYNVTVKFHLQ
jgi:TonB family protein